MIGIYARDVVTVITPSVNTLGDPTNTSTTADARFVASVRLVRNSEGEQVTASGYIRMKNAPSLGARITFEGRTYALLAIEQVKTFSRIDHYKVWVA